MSRESGSNGQINEKKIEPYILIRDIVVNWWVILLGAAAAAMLTYVALNLQYTPRYTTQATFAVSSRNATSSYSNLSSTNTMASTLQKVIESAAMQRILSDRLGVDTVDADISTDVITDTNLLELRVTAGNPREAFDIIHAIMDNYSEVSYYSLGDAVMMVLQEPQIPYSPINPLNVRSGMKKAAVFTGAALAVLLGLLSIMRDTVKREDEIEDKLDAKSLGAIAHEQKYKSLSERIRRRKNALLVSDPLAGFAFVEGQKKFASRVEYWVEEHGGKTIAVTSVSENEGKSTIAANLAINMAQRGKKVLLIDGDLQRPSQFLIFGIKMEESREFGEFLKKKTKINDVLIRTEIPGMFFMGGRNCYSSSTDMLQNGNISNVIQVCSRFVDYVIIDTPPVGVSGDAELFAQCADAVVLVVRQNFMLAEDINDALDRLRTRPHQHMGVVLNDVKSFSMGTAVGRYGSRYGYGRYGNYYKKQRD